MPHPQTELWSLVAVCNRCGGPTVIFTNLPENLSRIQGNYSVKCAGCNHQDLFPINRIRADGDYEGRGKKVSSGETLPTGVVVPEL